jgi:transposase
MDQKTQFIADYLREIFSFTELCARYGVSRETGYRLVERYLEQGPAGLEARSRRPHISPNETAPHIVEALLELRRRHPRWGAKKLLPLLGKRHPSWDLPARTTVFATATGWCRRSLGAGRSAIRAARRAGCSRRTTCGARTSRVSSRLATESTATR